MLFFMSLIWILFFFGFILFVTSIFTYIYSITYFYFFKKSNYFLLIFLNLLVIIPAHLFFGGQMTYTFKLSYNAETLNWTFYLGFLLYLFILSSYYIHKKIINRLLEKQQKESK